MEPSLSLYQLTSNRRLRVRTAIQREPMMVQRVIRYLLLLYLLDPRPSQRPHPHPCLYAVLKLSRPLVRRYAAQMSLVAVTKLRRDIGAISSLK